MKSILCFLFCLIFFWNSHIVIANDFPSEENLCKGINNSYECGKKIEKAWLPLLSGKVHRKNETKLVLSLNSGKKISRIDTPGNWEGHQNEKGEVNKKYTFFAYLPGSGYYVLRRQHWEDLSYEFINLNDATSQSIWGNLIFSPDKRLFVINEVHMAYDLHLIEVWGIFEKQLKKIATFEDKKWFSVNIRWLNNSTLEIDELNYDGKEKKIEYIKKTNGRWELKPLISP